MNVGERALKIVVSVVLAQSRDQLRAFINTMMNIFIKAWNFLIRKYQLIKELSYLKTKDIPVTGREGL
jgi:hypothetical protein